MVMNDEATLEHPEKETAVLLSLHVCLRKIGLVVHFLHLKVLSKTTTLSAKILVGLDTLITA